MKPSAELFQLIKSLKKTEKSHFRKFVSQHSHHKDLVYVQLFEAIDGQKVYNEKELVARLDKGQSFAVIKNYLYQLILKSLRNYYSGSSISIELKEQLINAEILHKKNLHTQALKLLDTVKKKAARYQDFTLMLQALKWERTIMLRYQINDWAQKKGPANYAAFKHALAMLNNLFTYYQIYDQLIHKMVDKGKRIDKEDFEALQELMKHPAMESTDQAKSIEAIYYFHEIRTRFHLYENNWDNFYHSINENIKHLKSNPDYVREDIDRLGIQYSNLLIGLRKKIRIKEFFTNLNDLKNLLHLFRKNSNDAMRIRITINAYKHELIMYLTLGKIEQCIESIENEAQLPLFYSNSITNRTVFYSIFINAYFYAGKWNRAMFWLNKLFNETSGTEGYSHYAYRIVKLIIHYELRNYDMINYLIKDTYRFLYKGQRIYLFESIILTFIRQHLANATTQKKLRNAFFDLRVKLEELKQDPYESRVFDYFDFIAWLDSKLDHISIPDAIRKRLPEDAIT